MSTITITKKETSILVNSPYHPDFPSAARNIGGKWNAAGGYWAFDQRDEARVRELCISVYGTDGEAASGDLVTLKVTAVDWSKRQGGLFLAGRCVARAYGRDSGAKLGEGVVVLEGKFRSGGSRSNWETYTERATFELRDVPRKAAEQAIEDHGRGLDRGWTMEIVEQGIDKEALKAEREKLAARIAEIDALLS